MHSITIYYYINTLRHVSAPSSAILRELEVILIKLLIHKGGEERRAETVCGCAHHVTRHNTFIHNILSTASQLSISQKALGTLPEDGNVMPKHVGATIHN
jgi:hypothetical protein